MPEPDLTPAIATLIAALDERPDARMIALAGPPGAGKSTLAQALCAALNARAPGCAVILPMDGYHLDNAVLDARGLRARKGAPMTFDVDGLRHDLTRVRARAETVLAPVFDRALDLSRNAAQPVTPAHRFVLVEGNYLLLDSAPWDSLSGLFDLTVFLPVPLPELARRLEGRWRDMGLPEEVVQARVHGNDIPNARLVWEHSRKADLVIGAGM